MSPKIYNSHILLYNICWKDILENPLAYYLPSVLGYIPVQLAPLFFGAISTLAKGRKLCKSLLLLFPLILSICRAEKFQFQLSGKNKSKKVFKAYQMKTTLKEVNN